MNKLPPQIITKYLSKKPEELKQCQELLAEENFAELKSIGHKFKGNGTTFGFPEFTEIGAKLEQAAKEENKDKLELVLNELSTWVQEKVLQ